MPCLFDPAIYGPKDAVAFAYIVSFSVQKWAETSTENYEPHRDVGDTEDMERTNDADEEKGGGFDAGWIAYV